MLSSAITVLNKHGLHARPAAMLTKTANLFSCRVTIIKDGRRADAKSILAVMTLAVKCGTEITIEVDGDGEDAALEALVSLVSSRFGEGQ